MNEKNYIDVKFWEITPQWRLEDCNDAKNPGHYKIIAQKDYEEYMEYVYMEDWSVVFEYPTCVPVYLQKKVKKLLTSELS